MAKGIPPSAWAGLIVGLLVASAVPAVLAVHGGIGAVRASAAIGAGTDRAAAASINYEFFDFWNVPWAEWWDLRMAIYGDRPIGAECFSAAGVSVGLCAPTNPDVQDIDTYPYTNWYPGVGNILPGNPNGDIYVNAPYRMRITGTAVEGYTLSEPVYFPVLKPSEPAGTRLDFAWRMQYITFAEAEALDAVGCSGVVFSNDGYIARSIITLTMDLQESRRLFGVVGTTADEARTWWGQNTRPECAFTGPAEAGVQSWFIQMGGSQFEYGRYDIYNGFEWFYQPFFTQVSATVAADGATTVTIDHGAWGTEVLLARFMYWGAAPYIGLGPDRTFGTADDIANYLDSTKAAGWRPDEVAWFEDLTFAGSFSGGAHSFTLTSAMHFHFQALADPGPNGLLDRTDDIPYWQWGPWLNDYVNDFSPKHLASELDRLPGATYAQAVPGHPKYGQALGYDFTPHTWDLAPWESAVFRFATPTGETVFYDPNLTPLGAHPLNQYVERPGPISLFSTKPANFGVWDDLAKTWTLSGGMTTGAPVGSPGPDGVPGTADDQYPLEPFPQVNIGMALPPPPSGADLVGRAAWPERHHWVQSKDPDGMVSLFAKVANLGVTPVTLAVIFEIRDVDGNLVGSIHTVTYTLDVGGTIVIEDKWTPVGTGRYLVSAQVHFDKDGDGTLDTFGLRVKRFSFAVVP